MEHYYCEICKGCIHSSDGIVEDKGSFYHSHCIEEEYKDFVDIEVIREEPLKLGFVS